MDKIINKFDKGLRDYLKFLLTAYKEMCGFYIYLVESGNGDNIGEQTYRIMKEVIAMIENEDERLIDILDNCTIAELSKDEILAINKSFLKAVGL